MPLNEIRKEIDSIDNELIPLLIKRFEASKKVGEIKIENKMPVLNRNREDEILEDIAKHSEEYADSLKNIYSVIFENSRQIQYNMMKDESDFIDMLEKISKNSEMKIETLVCPGIKGSFSDIAAHRMFSPQNTVYRSTFEEVFDFVSNHDNAVGVVPIENSNAGSVFETLDLLRKYDLTIFKGGDLAIMHCLIGTQTANESDITEVYSHRQALMQCSDFLKMRNIKQSECDNTALGAKKVSELNQKNVGCIASTQAAKNHNLKVLNDSIVNSKNNKTRFIAVAKHKFIPYDADKVSISFSLEHKTGSLYKALNKFALCGISLTNIQSRPMKDIDFEYYFYLDFKGNIRQENTRNLLYSIFNEVREFSFLGNYKEIDL